MYYIDLTMKYDIFNNYNINSKPVIPTHIQTITKYIEQLNTKENKIFYLTRHCFHY